MDIIDLAGSHYDFRLTDSGSYRNAKAHLYNGTSASSYRSIRSTKGRTGGKFYAEMLIGQNNTDVFVGIFPSTVNLGVTSPTYPGGDPVISGAGFGLYQAGSTFSKWSGDVGASYGNSFTTNSVVGCAIDTAAGKIWWSIGGVWQNSGDPAAGTGEAFSTLNSGTTYHFAGSGRLGSSYWTPTDGAVLTMRLASAAFDYSIPTGFSAWLPAASVSVTVRDEAAATINSTSFKWAFFEEVSPDLLAVPAATGTTSTNGAGVLAITIPYTTLANGGTGSLLISTTGGTAGVQCRSWYMPVTVTV